MRLLSSRSDAPAGTDAPVFGAMTRRAAGLVTVALAVVVAGVAVQRGTDSLPRPITLPEGVAQESPGPAHVIEPAGPVHLADTTGVAPAPDGLPAPGPDGLPAPTAGEPPSTVPGTTVLGVTVPGVTVPGVTVPGATVPGVTLPGVTLPPVALPAIPPVTQPPITLPFGLGR